MYNKKLMKIEKEQNKKRIKKEEKKKNTAIKTEINSEEWKKS